MIPPQDKVDWDNPEEHLSWALQAMPTFAGIGMVTNHGFLRQWSEHLVKAGVCHVDSLKRLADEDGNIHVSKLPQQQIKYQPPFRGPRHQYNNAARWVGKDTPDPEPIHLPDIKTLTIQENEAMLQQYRDAGMLNPYLPPPSVAEELN